MESETAACPDPSRSGSQRQGQPETHSLLPALLILWQNNQKGKKRFSEGSLKVLKVVVGLNGTQREEEEIWRCSGLYYSGWKVRERRNCSLLRTAHIPSVACGNFSSISRWLSPQVTLVRPHLIAVASACLHVCLPDCCPQPIYSSERFFMLVPLYLP